MFFYQLTFANYCIQENIHPYFIFAPFNLVVSILKLSLNEFKCLKLSFKTKTVSWQFQDWAKLLACVYTVER